MDNLNILRDKKLKNIFICSFYISKKKITDIVTIYLQFNLFFFSITIGDGNLNLDIISHIENSDFKIENDFFEYIIKNINIEFISFLDCKIVSIKKLVFREEMSNIYGIILYFNNQKQIIIYEDLDEELKITSNRKEIPLDLIEFDIK